MAEKVVLALFCSAVRGAGFTLRLRVLPLTAAVWEQVASQLAF